MIRDQNHMPRLDALRALAVTLVLLFHLDFKAFAFGYLGVDLFLMLSGFLMTHTMMRDRVRYGYFRVGAFYKRRVLRLLPSLTLTILICTFIALALMSPAHLIDTAYQGLSAQLFVSNIYFYEQAGYFEPANALRPLLHTWSLSLEEQFYILFGLALLLGNRTRFDLIVWFAFVGCAVATLAGVANAANLIDFSLWPVPEKLPEALFYLLPFRAAQFLAGCVVALIYLKRPPNSLQSTFFWSAVRRSLSLGALAPLVISFGNELYAPMILTFAIAPLLWRTPLLDRIGQFSPIRFLARISYQVYLIHWPIIVFWKYYTFDYIEPSSGLWLGLASLVGGWVLFMMNDKFIRWLHCSRAAMLLGIAMVFTLAILQGAMIHAQGFPRRIPAERTVFDPSAARAQESALCGQTHIAEDGRERGDRAEHPLITCENIREGGERIYLLGDSHARHLVPGFSTNYPDRSIAAMYFTSCLAQSGIEHYRYDYEGRNALATACEQRNLAMLSFFESLPPSQIVLHQYSGYAGDQSEEWYVAAHSLLNQLRTFGHDVIWVGSVPYPDILLADCLVAPFAFSDAALDRRCLGNLQTAKRILRSEGQRQSTFGSTYLNTTTFFCPQEDAASCRYLAEGKSLYRDSVHLNAQGSEKLVKWLRETYPQMPN